MGWYKSPVLAKESQMHHKEYLQDSQEGEASAQMYAGFPDHVLAQQRPGKMN